GTSKRLVNAVHGGEPTFTHPIFEPLLRRTDLQGLPLAMGSDCLIGNEAAQHLQDHSRKLREYLSQPRMRNDVEGRIDADSLRRSLAAERAVWQHEDALPALVQLLQTEDRPIRLLLVEQLHNIQGPAASAALARRAVFDLSVEVRQAAVLALKDRPREEYRQLLLDGLRYPWAPAADHAAEALVALNDREAISALAELLGEPDPTLPASRTVESVDRSQIFTPRFAKEAPLSLVALNERQGNQRRTALL